MAYSKHLSDKSCLDACDLTRKHVLLKTAYERGPRESTEVELLYENIYLNMGFIYLNCLRQ